MRLVLVCLGGAAGSGARYLLAEWLGALLGRAWPWGTLAVNLLGCFAIEVVLVAGGRAALLSPAAVLTLSTGFMGGFTTYSAFNNQVMSLFRDGAWVRGAGYAAATALGCVVAGVLGMWAGRAWFGQAG